MRRIYLDHSATTKIKKEVYDEMKPYLLSNFGNPSSVYYYGINNIKDINAARARIANCINAEQNEILFCSGGSEANNWAIKGISFNNIKKREIITTKIEHHSLIDSCNFLRKNGFIIKYIDVDNQGFINLDQLKKSITNNTLLVSVMMANNEIGTIQNIRRISDLCKEHRTIFHTDAVQAVGHIPIDVKQINVDMMSISAHKFYGPKGIGCLYIKKGIEIENLIHGGKQENHKRAGTENVPGIIGMAKAIEIETKNLLSESNRQRNLISLLTQKLKNKIRNIKINGPEIGEKRLPSNLNISFKNIDGALLSYQLSERGIYVSTGSACDSDSIKPSHVLTAIGVPDEYINGSIRISLGEETTEEEINIFVSEISDIIDKNVKCVVNNG